MINFRTSLITSADGFLSFMDPECIVPTVFSVPFSMRMNFNVKGGLLSTAVKGSAGAASPVMYSVKEISLIGLSSDNHRQFSKSPAEQRTSIAGRFASDAK